MMKRYINLYLKSFLILNLIFFLLAVIVYRRTGNMLPFIRLEFGVLIISLFLALSLFVFKLEQGNRIINVIIGYVVLIPSLFLIRFLFGTALFRFSWLFYILLIIVGIIYGIALYIVSKKYKNIADELNRLIEEKKNLDNHTDIK
jgi:hypothetical protein